MLTKEGILVEACNDMIIQHAKFASRIEDIDLKIYTLAKTVKDFTRNMTLKSKSCFSVIKEIKEDFSESEAFAKEAEGILIAVEIIKKFLKYFTSNVVIQLSHTHLLSLLANKIGLTSIDDYKILAKIAADTSEQAIKKNERLISEICKGTSYNISLLQAFLRLKRETLDSLIPKLKKLFGSADPILARLLVNLEAIDDLLYEHLGSDIVLSYGTVNKTFEKFTYHSGLVFQILTVREAFAKKRKSPDRIELAFGGRFDNSVDSFKPNLSQNRVFAFGLVLRNYEVLQFIKSYTDEFKDPRLEIDIYNSVNVVVATTESTGMSEEIFRVAAELWKNCIKCQTQIKPLEQKDHLLDTFKKRGVSHLVLAKSSPEGGAKLYLKNLQSKGREVDMSLGEIVEEIKSKRHCLDYLTTDERFSLLDNLLKK